ncbi:hypothetical protein UMM65_12830 [Aureibaculum sp. 2210JD6-5]|uniref:hypothetical protein n=1 Tax=Aureibaculum sp. 2210JD6-5 TaxID=3103957 RepID=UPI002AACFB38|nr:hypothetical protein [Aureibaculum sp. 2210JD6-5]MDY7396128.1 hypothetical protein [Aureibaculum sp. 2210JD6-5]
MQNRKIILVLFLISFSALKLHSQYYDAETAYKKCFVGSTLFMLMNLDSNERPDFIQLNLGYRLTGKDVISLELKTWKYHKPLGLPYGKSFNAPEEKFPGYIREYGFALTYQRFWWKGLYTGIHVMNAWQSFINNSGDKIDNGFQVFNTYRLGYHIKLFKGTFFIEPSIAITHRPYHTKMPESFKKLDDKHSKFFFGEPGLHFGFNF